MRSRVKYLMQTRGILRTLTDLKRLFRCARREMADKNNFVYKLGEYIFRRCELYSRIKKADNVCILL